MDMAFCLDILRQGLKINNPTIINTDQGSQFTSLDWIRQQLKSSIIIKDLTKP
jgi:hypothetical protein